MPVCSTFFFPSHVGAFFSIETERSHPAIEMKFVFRVEATQTVFLRQDFKFCMFPSLLRFSLNKWSSVLLLPFDFPPECKLQPLFHAPFPYQDLKVTCNSKRAKRSVWTAHWHIKRSFHNATLIYCKTLCKRFFLRLEHGLGKRTAKEEIKKRKCRPQSVDDERKTTKREEKKR